MGMFVCCAELFSYLDILMFFLIENEKTLYAVVNQENTLFKIIEYIKTICSKIPW